MFISTRFLLLVLSSVTLAACGGGGGGGGGDSGSATTTASVSPVNPVVSLASAEMAKYEGVWREELDAELNTCFDHMRRTATLVATGAQVFTVTPQEQLFDYADCTGAVVATGSFGTLRETVQYQSIESNASVTFSNGNVITASVDLGTSVQSVATFVYTGSGVTTTLDEGPTTLTHVNYANGKYANILSAKTNGQTTSGGLLLFNGELLAVVPVAGSSTTFAVNRRYIR
jgi:hypothetical protein